MCARVCKKVSQERKKEHRPEEEQPREERSSKALTPPGCRTPLGRHRPRREPASVTQGRAPLRPGGEQRPISHTSEPAAASSGQDFPDRDVGGVTEVAFGEGAAGRGLLPAEGSRGQVCRAEDQRRQRTDRDACERWQEIETVQRRLRRAC